jgi:hypothetical protein
MDTADKAFRKNLDSARSMDDSPILDSVTRGVKSRNSNKTESDCHRCLL